MTTGRINQVAILSFRAGPPAGGGTSQERAPGGAPELRYEGGARGPGRRLPSARGSYEACAAPIQLPPLSSPRGGPPRGVVGPQGPPYAATCAPQKEGTRPRPRPGAATGWGLPPRIWRSVGHQPAVHRPLVSPAGRGGQRGFGPRPRAPGSATLVDLPAGQQMARGGHRPW
jgi:hypothetical protein